jgi:hypothetical protein
MLTALMLSLPSLPQDINTNITTNNKFGKVVKMLFVNNPLLIAAFNNVVKYVYPEEE